MCHYAAAQLTFPEPAVICVTLLEPTVDVVPVSPAPIVIVKVVGYLKITTFTAGTDDVSWAAA